ncbi:MAG: hypothetical protein OHK0053_03710 [Microscillaceae bacterium]
MADKITVSNNTGRDVLVEAILLSSNWQVRVFDPNRDYGTILQVNGTVNIPGATTAFYIETTTNGGTVKAIPDTANYAIPPHNSPKEISSQDNGKPASTVKIR